MGMVLFYHLMQSTVEDTVATLLTRALGQGWRVMLRGTDARRLDRLDARLWTDPPDGFLPHGMAGGAHDADQPVLIGTGAAVNGARALMLVDGAVASLEEAGALQRVWLLFEGADTAAVEPARGEWRRLTGAGVPAQYWSDEGGRWVMKTEKLPG
jgi:DNA polymerase III subunit chi